MADLASGSVSRLALGTVQFGLSYGIANRSGKVAEDEANAILNYAKQQGVNTLDTAIAYGDSEQRLGEIGIAGWRVVSKLPPIPEPCADVEKWVGNAAAQSLRRLKIDSLYGLLLHRPNQLLEANGPRLYQALQRLKEDGLVSKIGVSIYDPAEAEVLTARYELDMVQAPFNVLDRRLLDCGGMMRLQKLGIELHVRSIFLQGLLLIPSHSRPEKFARWQPVLNRWDSWLKSSGLTPLQACLRYAMQFPQIDRVVVGVDSLQQLAEVLSAADGSGIAIPDELSCDDADLVNPARWNVSE